MKVVLNDDDVREALLAAALAKIGNMLSVDADACWIEVTAAGKDVENLEEVTFHMPISG